MRMAHWSIPIALAALAAAPLSCGDDGGSGTAGEHAFLYGCWLSCESEGTASEPCDPDHLWGVAFAEDGKIYECHRIDEPPYDVFQIEITEEWPEWSSDGETVSTQAYYDYSALDYSPFNFKYEIIGDDKFQIVEAMGDGEQWAEGDEDFPEPYESKGRMRRVATLEELGL